MRNTSTVPSYSFDKETGWRLDLPMSIVPGTRVLCLYRVSTTKQLYRDMNDEADIPMQRLRCREFAQQNGWTIVCELQEEGISGHKVRAENRDKIQMIKDYAVKQKFDILLVFMFDRIGRIADETPFVVEWLISHGIRVWASQEGEQRIDNHTDRLMNYIRFWQADGESQKTSIRTANSMHILTEQGYFTGGTRPYGYDLVKSGRMNKKKQEVHDLAINEEEAAQIRLMFHLAYTYGYGAQSIVNHMNANGYKNRSGKNWHPSTVQAILRNKTYTGILKSGDTLSPVQDQLCIVEKNVFDSVQDMLAVRSRRYQQTRSAPLNTRGSSLLAGNIFCGHCGARLCITTSGKGRRRADGTDVVRTRYCCQTKTRTHGECGGQSGYTVHKVDEIIDTFVRSVLEKVRAVDRTEIVQAQNRIDIESKKQHIRELRRDAEKAESELQKLQSEIIRSLTGESAFTPQMLRPAIDAQERKFADLMQTLHAAEEDMHDSENNLLALTERFDDVLHWATMYNNADMAAKKMIVSRIIERVDMFRDYEIRITLNISIEQFLNTIEIVA
jgi:DNA invertase Pin-like site-specific DNA recombinase